MLESLNQPAKGSLKARFKNILSPLSNEWIT